MVEETLKKKDVVHMCLFLSLSLRSGLVSEMLEKNIPFSEWDHLTVLAWLEVSACIRLLIFQERM